MRGLNAQRANRIGLAREIEKRIKAMYRYSVALRMNDTGARGKYFDFLGQLWVGEVDEDLEDPLLRALKKFVEDYFWRKRNQTGAAKRYKFTEIHEWVYFTQESDGWQEVEYAPAYLDRYELRVEDHQTGQILDYKQGNVNSL